MAARDKLRKLLSLPGLDDEWASLDDKEKESKLDYYQSNPQEIEKLLYKVYPDYYIINQQDPNYVRNIVNNFVPESTLGSAYQGIKDAPLSLAKGLAGVLTPLGIKSPYEALKEWEQETQGYVNPENQRAYSVGKSLTSSLGFSIPAALSPVSAPVALGISLLPNALSAGGEAAAEHIEEGGGRIGAALKGTGYALAEAIPEIIPSYGALKATRGIVGGEALRSVVPQFLKAGASDIVGELSTTASEDFINRVAGTGDMSPLGDKLKETAIQSAIQIPISSSVMGATGAVMGRVNKRNYDKATKSLNEAVQSGLDNGQIKVTKNGQSVAMSADEVANLLLSDTEEDGALFNRETQEEDIFKNVVVEEKEIDGKVFNSIDLGTLDNLNSTGIEDIVLTQGETVKIPVVLSKRARVRKSVMEGGGQLENTKLFLDGVLNEIDEENNLGLVDLRTPEQRIEDSNLTEKELKSKQMAEGTLQWFPIQALKYGELRRKRDTSLKSENIGNKIPKVTQFILDVIEASEKNREKAGLPADQNKILKNLNIGKGKAYGFIKFLPENGEHVAVEVGLDWLLLHNKQKAARTIAHESGHMLSGLLREYLSPTEKSSFLLENDRLNKFVSDFADSYNKVLKEPIQNAGMDYTDMMSTFKTLLKTLPPSANSVDVMNLWNSVKRKKTVDNILAGKYDPATFKGIYVSDFEKGMTKDEVNKLIQDKKFPDINKVKSKLFTDVSALTDEMLYLGILSRGLSPRAVKADPALYAGLLDSEENFADFFSAYFNGTQYKRPDGSWGNMVDEIAPTAKRLFEDYMDNRPEVKKFMHEYFVAESKDDNVGRIIEAVKKAREKYRKGRSKKVETESEVYNRFIGAGLFNKLGYGLINQNLPLFKQLKEADLIPIINEIEKIENMASLAEARVVEIGRIFEKGIKDIQSKYPETINMGEDLSTLLDSYLGLKRIASGGRTKNVPVETDAYRKTKDGTIEGKTFRTMLPVDIFTAEFTMSPEEARKNLESGHFEKYKDFFEEVSNNFDNYWNNEVLEEALYSGIISQNEYNRLQSVDGSYIPFYIWQEAERRQDRVFMSEAFKPIREQHGTLDTPSDLVGSSIRKGLGLLYYSKYNNLMRSIVEALSSADNGDGSLVTKPVRVSEKSDIRSRQLSAKPKPGWAAITYLDNGKEYLAYTPKIFTESFERGNTNNLAVILAPLTKLSDYYKKLVTTYSISYLPRNVSRDFSTYTKNIVAPDGKRIIAKNIEAIKEYAKAMYEVLTGKEGMESEIVEALKAGIINSGRTPSSDAATIRETMADEYKRIYTDKFDIESMRKGAGLLDILTSLVGKIPKIQRYDDTNLMDMSTKEKVAALIKQPFRVYAKGMARLNAKLERVPKMAALRFYKPYADNGIISQDEYEVLSRYAGSPFFMNRGAWHPLTGALGMFFNARMQDMYRDAFMARYSKQALGKQIIIPATIFALQQGILGLMVSSGAAGEEYKHFWDCVPGYDKDRGIIIPLGMTPDGKAVYWCVPHDEMTAMFKSIFRNLSQNAEYDTSIMSSAYSAFSSLTEVSMNPALTLLFEAYQLSSGVNPKDYFRNRSVIPDRAFREGGTELLKEIAKTYYNELSPLAPMYKFSYDDIRYKANMPPKNELEAICGLIQKGLRVPFAQAFLKAGLLRVSNQGLTEKRDNILANDKSFQAKTNRLFSELAQDIVLGDHQGVTESIENIRQLKPLTMGQMQILSTNAGKLGDFMKNDIKGIALSPRELVLINSSISDKLTLLQKGF
jgi:hypothetical protein